MTAATEGTLSGSSWFKVIGLTAVAWLLELGAFFIVVGSALSGSVVVASEVFMPVPGTLATLIPGAPGHFGTFDFFAAEGFRDQRTALRKSVGGSSCVPHRRPRAGHSSWQLSAHRRPTRLAPCPLIVEFMKCRVSRSRQTRPVHAWSWWELDSRACPRLMNSRGEAFGQLSWKPSPRSGVWQPAFRSMGHVSNAFITTGSQMIITSSSCARIGLENRVVYKPTRTGMYFANQIYRLSTPLDVLRFSALPVFDRVRLGLTVLRARRVRNWCEIDHLSAAEWLRKLGGDRAFRLVWEPLLRGEFGPHAEEVSAAWFWSKLRLRGGSRGARGEEQLAYFRGGFAALADELVIYHLEAAERCA